MADRRILLAASSTDQRLLEPTDDPRRLRSYQYAEGSAIIERHAGSGTEIGGMIRGAAAGLELVPTLFTSPCPPARRGRAFEALRRHRAPCATARPSTARSSSCIGPWCGGRRMPCRGRALCGVSHPTRPSLPRFDYHANISQAGDATDVLDGHDTFPHSDFFERGEEAASILGRLLDGMERPAKAFRKLPLCRRR